MEKSIYDLGLNDRTCFVETIENYPKPLKSFEYVRVPGGWVYSDSNGCCFVPFNPEFAPGMEGMVMVTECAQCGAAEGQPHADWCTALPSGEGDAFVPVDDGGE